MAVFSLLACPETYRACDTDLLTDPAARDYWLELFESQFEVQLEAAASAGFDAAACARSRIVLNRELELVKRQPDRHGSLDLLILDELRRKALAAGGIRDEFRLIKQRENEAALASLPHRLKVLDALGDSGCFDQLIRGVLAGNLFDMGVKDTARRYARDSVPFEQALEAVPERPWLVDDLDQASQSLAVECCTGKIIAFADNAGGDVVLGLLPLARFFLRRGAEIILAANTHPSLNDVTAEELDGILQRAALVDDAFSSSGLRVVDSGCAAPLIDLSQVSDALVHAARGADLVLLIGMGRAIESNRSVSFTCPCMRVAMVKDPEVARSLGGSMYDAVVSFDEPGSTGRV